MPHLPVLWARQSNKSEDSLSHNKAHNVNRSQFLQNTELDQTNTDYRFQQAMIIFLHDSAMTSNRENPPPKRLPKRIVFANSKGGCGKSTLATNLASFYARQGVAVTLLDYDRQGWASQWLQRRSEQAPLIRGIAAFESENVCSTRNWFMRIPRDTERVIIDTPAGLSGQKLVDMVAQADMIIVPVLPSSIDIHCATRFISSILLSGAFRHGDKKLLVLANRVRKNTRSLVKLDMFLNGLKLPRAGDIRDTQNYVNCLELGAGIVDVPTARTRPDREQWHKLVTWIDQQWSNESPQQHSTSGGQQTQNTLAEVHSTSSKSGKGVYTVV